MRTLVVLAGVVCERRNNLSMAIDVDISGPVHGIAGKQELIRAVLGADPSDESDWLEWKTELDLRQKPGCFHVAKAILGMANRTVEAAARSCGGYGYVVIGAEPRNLTGVFVPDPADWVTRVQTYLGSEKGPSWDQSVVPIDNQNVLVVTVPPPRAGDPIWPLRKELDPHPSGRLFVRKSGRTHPANADDIDALNRRAIAARTEALQITVE
jgi:hypothetical protein